MLNLVVRKETARVLLMVFQEFSLKLETMWLASGEKDEVTVTVNCRT